MNRTSDNPFTLLEALDRLLEAAEYALENDDEYLNEATQERWRQAIEHVSIVAKAINEAEIMSGREAS